MKIHKIYTMEGEYEDVIFNENKYAFIESISDGRFVKIKDHEKEIYINSNYIISFEI